jgi:hypothetical protein
MQGRGGTVESLLVPWLASGRPADWERFRAAVVHNLDVDALHASGRETGTVGTVHGPGPTHWSAPASLAWTYPAAWLDFYYLSGEPRARDMIEALVGSTAGRTIGDFGAQDRAWSSRQAGFLRTRLVAHEAFGEEHAKAAAAALDHFSRISTRELGRSGWARELAPALIRYHRLTGDASTAQLIERGTHAYVSSRGPAAARGDVIDRNCVDACAYAWRLTGDRYFLQRGLELANRSAAQAARGMQVESEAEPPPHLARDARVIRELGTLPYLQAALREAGMSD